MLAIVQNIQDYETAVVTRSSPHSVSFYVTDFMKYNKQLFLILIRNKKLNLIDFTILFPLAGKYIAGSSGKPNPTVLQIITIAVLLRLFL